MEDIEEQYAWCGMCKEWKFKSEFARNKNRKNGVQARCKSCRRFMGQDPIARDKSRDRLLRHKFGITLKQYNRILAKQGGVCAMCKQPERAKAPNGEIKMLAVDHCHKTLKRRKLLCQRCNIGIGHLDTIELLEAAIEYLRQNETAIAIA